jgi:hypothetical protein
MTMIITYAMFLANMIWYNTTIEASSKPTTDSKSLLNHDSINLPIFMTKFEKIFVNIPEIICGPCL